jgi:tRNA(adenine34) deaminase
MKEEFIKLAIKESFKAVKKNNVPVGAVIIRKNKVIAKAHNLKKLSNNVMDHAEIICIKKASRKLRDWRLNDCEMYVTLEPCNMCEAVINASRINKVYFLSKRTNNVCLKQTKLINIEDDLKIDSLKNEKNLKDFFKKRRYK